MSELQRGQCGLRDLDILFDLGATARTYAPVRPRAD
jgi:hypothetical protein